MSKTSLSITILVDNLADRGLAAEHGLSLWIEGSERPVLFDTGQGKALGTNARRLGVDLSRAEDIVISHGHYDHTGGIAEALRCAPRARVFLHRDALLDRFSVEPVREPRQVGMPSPTRTALESLPAERIVWVAEPQRLAPTIGLTGPIPRESTFEDVGGPFFLDAIGTQKDPITDDQALWIETRAGLVVCLGCGHAGLVNTLDHVRRVSGTARIRAVIGGFHLVQAGEERIARTLAALESAAPELIVPCHCTGEGAVAALKRVLGARVLAGHAGLTLRFPGSQPCEVIVTPSPL